jgi:molecular chaperone HscC
VSDINPDFVVAIGTGVAAGIKQRNEDIKDMLLTDICPFSLGVEIKMDGKDGVFDAIISRNASLPISLMKSYTTTRNNQTSLKFKIYQGEAFEAKSNLLIGECEIDIPPLSVGEAIVYVRFTYDINGILEVEANCLQSGTEASAVIIRNKRLSQSEIDKRISELRTFRNLSSNDENNLLVARGRRLFEEFSGAAQHEIKVKLAEFESALEQGMNPARLAMMRTNMCSYFDKLDAYSESLLLYGEADDSFYGGLDGEEN